MCIVATTDGGWKKNDKRSWPLIQPDVWCKMTQTEVQPEKEHEEEEEEGEEEEETAMDQQFMESC